MKRGCKQQSTGIKARALVAVFILGTGMILYPFLSNYYNSFHATRAIIDYAESVSALNEEDTDKIIQSAQEYNRELSNSGTQFNRSEELKTRYQSELNPDGDGIMGYLEIPKTEIYLPVYHGTEDNVLQVAAGHVDWSSLPVGGSGTHCVISGHRGLPSARLFTDIDKLEKGDEIYMSVLDRTYTYIVDNSYIVLPQDVDNLKIENGKDYLSLVTCTPYGVNTHRLIVRAVRLENAENSVKVTARPEGEIIAPIVTAPIIGIPVLVIMLILINFRDGMIKRRIEKEYADSLRLPWRC